MKKKNQTKKPRGRPVKNVIKLIDATPEEVARAISLAADKKLAQKRKNQNLVCVVMYIIPDHF